jgi:DNA invertase Pin-like site-specific DNA recombinase
MASKMIQVLGAARLSDETDESTSIKRQKAGIEQWAALRASVTGDDYHVIEVTEDSDVSGVVSPFERAGLGPYLRRPLLDQWQTLVVYRLDRLTRSIADFEALWKHLEANGKTLVSVAEQIDFGTPAGRLMARQLVLFAEYEREIIRQRVKNAYESMRAGGKYTGMQFPFGYMPVKLDGKGWGFEPHPIYSHTVSEIVEKLLAGESLGSICRWLESEGIPTPRNAVREYKGKRALDESARWFPTTLTKILRSPTIIGESVANGKTLRDSSGMAIKFAEPLIDREQWEQVKAILDDNAAHVGAKVKISPLLQVVFCDKCKSPMYVNSTVTDGKVYRYYACTSAMRKRGCDAKRVNADTLETLVEQTLMAMLGEVQITETEEIAGTDYSSQMAELAEAIGALSSQIALGRVHKQDVSKLEEQRGIHEANLAKLAEEPTKAPETREVPTGETWAERWNRLDWNGRNELMRRKGVKFYAAKDGKMVGGHMVTGLAKLDESGRIVPGEILEEAEGSLPKAIS